MASPRRIQLIPLSQPASDAAPSPGLGAPAAPPAPPGPRAEGVGLCARLELLLFEPDDERCAEFHYPELTAVRSDESVRALLEEEEEELQVGVLHKKSGGAPGQRRDRVQDLVDMGYGYDDDDSFIDNSEAYDELVPACLTTKYGGFYINVGTLQFRQASGDENETDDFEEEVKPKKRKLKEGGMMKMNKKKKRKKDVWSKAEIIKHRIGAGDKKKKASKQQQNLDGMLRKFHKEKLQELQLFKANRKESPSAAQHDSSEQVDSGSADELHQAVEEQDEILTNDQSQKNQGTLAETLQASRPQGLSLAPGRNLQELAQDDQLAVLIRRLEETVLRVMPDQIDRFNSHCQAHSEARAAKLEAVKEKRVVEGSDEDEDDSSGKRVSGPRKRFRWNEEIRALVCDVVKLKMSRFELEGAGDQSLEDYLKSFLEASVKTLWPRGWMQSRILLIESRRVHAHVTGVVARKRSMTVPKSEKGRRGAGVCPGNTGSKVTPHDLTYTASGNIQILMQTLQFEESVDVQMGAVNKALAGVKSQKIPPGGGGVSVLKSFPAGEGKPQIAAGVEGDGYLCSAPFNLAVAAMEGSCGDPDLPTPSLSHQTSRPSAPESAVLTTPQDAFPFPALPAGQTEICKTSVLTGAAPGTFQYGLSHDGSQIRAGGANAQRKLQ